MAYIRFIWIPVIILTSVLSSYFSTKINNDAGTRWFIASWCLGLLPIWTVISKFSNNLVLDGMMFDILIFVSYAVALSIFTKTHTFFMFLQWCGFGLAIVGFFIMQLGGNK